jgi:hypothetical protein
MKKLLLFIALILTFSPYADRKSAIATDQNIFGLHLARTTDIYKAKALSTPVRVMGWAQQ